MNWSITDAQGDANVQIQQIQSMIDADVDAILSIAGSSTALDRVVADACEKGIAIINFDSLVDTNELTAKINTDPNEVGRARRQVAGRQARRQGQDPRPQRSGRRLGERGASRRAPSRSSRRPIRASRSSAPRPTPLQRGARPGGGDQPALRPSRDRRHLVARAARCRPAPCWRWTGGPQDGRRSPARTTSQFLELWKEKGFERLGHHAAELARRHSPSMPPSRRCRARTFPPSSRCRCRSSTTQPRRVSGAGKDFPADGYIYSPCDEKLFDELIAGSQ